MSSRPTPRSEEDPLQDGCPTTSQSKTQHQNSKLCFVCVGAGRGSRFGCDKLAELIGERTVFATTLSALREAVPTAPLVVVVPVGLVETWRNRLGGEFPEAVFVGGGARRQDSVQAGVQAACELGAEVVAIHDAARPLLDPRDLHRLLAGLGEADGALLTERITDTVKQVGADGLVVHTVDRESLRFASTPQVFRVASLQAAWDSTGNGDEWTDESALLEAAGMRIRSVASRFPNPKLTTRSDLEMIRALAGATS